MRQFSPRGKDIDPEFDIGSQDDILSERDVGTYKPKETVSRVKINPG